MKHKRPYISVVIPAHNEQEYIEDTLKALKKQTYKDFEIVVVADSCKDNTAKIAKKYTKKVIVANLKGQSKAMNLGAKNSVGELLVFVDADIQLTENSLATIKKKFKETHSVGTIKGSPDEKRLRYHSIYIYQNFVHRYGIYKQAAGVIICWRKMFEKYGGFEEDIQVLMDRKFILKMIKHGKYVYITPATGVISMRRYEKEGLLQMGYFWLKTWIFSKTPKIKKRTYKVVR